MLIKSNQEIMEITGNLSYHDGARAWNTLRLKKHVLNEFSELKDRAAKVTYKMIYSTSVDNLIKLMQKVNEKEGALPILLFFEK